MSKPRLPVLITLAVDARHCLFLNRYGAAYRNNAESLYMLPPGRQ